MHRKRLIVLVFGVLALAGCSAKVSTSATTTTAASSATTATTGAPATTAATSPPTTKAAGKPSGKDGTFAFTVTGQQCGLTTVGSGPLAQTAPSGSSWCVYNLTVMNDKGSSGDYFAGNQKAIDASGKQLSVDTTALIYMDNASASETSTINPGISVDVVMPVQVANGDTIKYLELHDSAFSGGVKVPV
jgi:hypothetical protein